MSASPSAAASSTLTRSKAAILLFTSLAAAYLIYYHQASFFSATDPSVAGPGLHRSNAVHRTRRRGRTNEAGGEDGLQETANDAAEDGDTGDSIARPLGDGETVVDEPWHDDWSNWGADPQSQRNGQNIVQLLFRVSEDATRRNAYVHRGCQCNSCGTVPIRGIRYRCSNCADFDLCEACEAQGMHNKTHIFYKVRVPTSSFATRQTQPVWYPGDPDTCMKSLPKELMNRLSKETGFDRPELDAYWEQWTFMANTEWREDPDDLCLAMDRKTFDQCLVPSVGNRHAAPNLIHDRMFAFYDTNKDDIISFPEFLNGLAYRKKKDKLKRVFEGYDIDGDGFVARKDFLRMFRSYYVLFKQMHRDMLEGLDDQVMNSTDAHQLVTSRQPLSSAFGRDGRFPPAPNPRTGEGKSPGIDGDLAINDGKGVISDSSNDFGNREDVIIDAVVREYPRQPQSWAPTASNTYWQALMNPPETIASLQHELLEVLINERRRMPQDTGRPGQYQSNNAESEPNDTSEYGDLDVIDRDWPPSFVTLPDVEALCGEGTTFAAVQPSRRREIVDHAIRRLQELQVNQQTLVAEKIHERYKRRWFYTDMEEGAGPPPDWKEEEDIPQEYWEAVETSKEVAVPSRPISPRSRSSSKVRFAEDTDDYETRSNPSTSSRSIPERWGGMEIPDAEKDAGKEILYQVTQQACNELLDQLFKKQEDLAVAALSSKKARDKYRRLFTNSNFEQWALGLDMSLKKTKNMRANVIIEAPKEAQKDTVVPEVELPELRHQPLDELLAVTGYIVNPEAGDVTSPAPTPDPGADSRNTDLAQILPEIGTFHLDYGTTSYSIRVHMPGSTTAVEYVPSPINGFIAASEARATEGGRVLSESHETPTASLQQGTPVSSHDADLSYRDPTLPQFRPDSVPLDSANSGSPVIQPQIILPVSGERGQPGSSDSPPTTEGRSISQGLDEALPGSNPASDARRAGQPRSAKRDDRPLLARFEKSQFTVGKQKVLDAMPEDIRKEFEKIDWQVLYELREMDAIEKQAEARGGWGRLNWEEFEQVIKGEDASPLNETSRRMMDWLGSWIEFCIP